MELTGSSIDTIKFFFSRNKFNYSMLFILSLIVGFFEAISTVAIYPVIKYADSQNVDNENDFLSKIINFTTDLTAVSPLEASVYLLLTFTFIKLVLVYLNTLFSWIVSNKLIQNIRVELIDKFLKIDYNEVVNADRGDFTFRVINAPGFIGKCMNTLVLMSVELFKIIMIILSLLFIDKEITLIMLVITATFLIINFLITKKVSYGTGSGRAKSAAKQVAQAINIINGHKSIRLFGVIDYWILRFKKEVMNFYRIAFKDTLIGDLPKYFFEMIAITGLALIILFYTQDNSSLSTKLPTIGVFSLALLRLMPSIKNAGTMNRTFMADLPNAEAAYLALNEMIPKVIDRKNRITIHDFNDKIIFDNVSFFYHEQTNSPVIKNGTFSISAGEFVGIIGESGSGKTTILDLITNLLNINDGEILIDGHPINSIDEKSISKLIGYVGQDPFFFNGTIKENILFGREGFTDSDIEDVLSNVEMLDFLKSKKEYINFKLADSGLKISGGQRQRLNLARALIGKPKILVLDESTSNLDTETESRIVKTILRLIKEEKITVIFVTHRISAVQNADKIIKINNGIITLSDNN